MLLAFSALSPENIFLPSVLPVSSGEFKTRNLYAALKENKKTGPFQEPAQCREV
jgi:hypothetical protein